MLYIGFSKQSHKIHAKLFCKNYKHCAPIVIKGNTVVIYQFVRINKIVKITVNKKDLSVLEKYGWKFIAYPIDTEKIPHSHYLTCVQFTKHMCGIKDIKIQTPFALFEYLNKK